MQRTHLVPEISSWWPSRRQGLDWGSVSGAHLVVLVSADVQGCRGLDLAGYGDLGIRKKQTNISIDAILLTMQQVHRVFGEVFPVLVDPINAT